VDIPRITKSKIVVTLGKREERSGRGEKDARELGVGE
jgi:hypothetical protein